MSLLVLCIVPMIMHAERAKQHNVDDLFISRWSPRAMSGASLTDAELMQLFEAARWAPSEYNSQSWRFVYAKRDTPAWNTLFNLLVPFNQEWCKNAAVLVVVVSKNTYDDGSPIKTHSYDTGAAWQSFALQGHMSGLVVHGMSGFDYDRARIDLHIPEGYTIEAMIAIGKPASSEVLPEGMRSAEQQKSSRKPLKDMVFEGSFSS